MAPIFMSYRKERVLPRRRGAHLLHLHSHHDNRKEPSMSDLRTLETKAENWVLANWKKLLTSHVAAGALGWIFKALF